MERVLVDGNAVPLMAGPGEDIEYRTYELSAELEDTRPAGC